MLRFCYTIGSKWFVSTRMNSNHIYKRHVDSFLKTCKHNSSNGMYTSATTFTISIQNRSCAMCSFHSLYLEHFSSVIDWFSLNYFFLGKRKAFRFEVEQESINFYLRKDWVQIDCIRLCLGLKSKCGGCLCFIKCT